MYATKNKRMRILYDEEYNVEWNSCDKRRNGD